MSADRGFIVYSCESCGRRIFSERHLLGTMGVCPVCGKESVVGGVLALGSGGHQQVGGSSGAHPATGDGSGAVPAQGTKSGGWSSGGHPAAGNASGGWGSGAQPILGNQSGGWGSGGYPAGGAPAAGDASGPVIPEPIPVAANERRRSPRFNVENASVQVEGGSKKGGGLWDGVASYDIFDISEVGLCIVTKGPEDKKAIRGYRPPDFKIGEEIGVTLHLPGTFRPINVGGRIARIDQMGHKNEYQIGVAFSKLSPDSRSELRRLAKKHAGQSR